MSLACPGLLRNPILVLQPHGSFIRDLGGAWDRLSLPGPPQGRNQGLLFWLFEGCLKVSSGTV